MLAAEALGEVLRGGEVLALVGDLGSGKTTFTKGLCRGLGVKEPREVSSPTYVLEHVYEARVPVRHYDAYRLTSPEELAMLGFHDHLTGGEVLVVEWADRVLAALPEERLTVELRHGQAEERSQGAGSITRRHAHISGPARVWRGKLDPLLKFRPWPGR